MKTRERLFPEFQISKTIDAFRQPPCSPPHGKEVLERFFGVLYSQPKNRRNFIAAGHTAAAEMDALWLVGDARIPRNTIETIKKKILKFRELLQYLLNKSKKGRPVYAEVLAKFKLLRDSYFDITTDDAIEVVMADSKKTLEVREEDAVFIRRLRGNEFVAFGARDWDQQGRFDRALERQEKEDARIENERQRKIEDEKTLSSEVIDDDDEPVPSQRREDESSDPDYVPCDMKGKTKPESFSVTFVQREWIKPVIPAADRTDDSNDDLFYKLKALLVGNGVNLDDVFLSPSLIGDIRREVHLETAADIKENFPFPDLLQLFFDGKQREDPVTGIKKEGIAVSVRGPGMEKEKFLGNKKVEGKGTGRACGGVVIEVVFEWKLRNNVKALNYDTCPINTGGDNGACLIIERAMGRPLMWFPCVHHIFELIVGAMVQQRWPTGGPRDAIYTRFKNEWPEIREKMPNIIERGAEKVSLVAPEDDVTRRLSLRLNPLLEQLEGEAEACKKAKKSKNLPRGDYKEFVRLISIREGFFLTGRKPTLEMTKRLNATHHARWMGNIIHILKMLLVGEHFPLSVQQQADILVMSYFIIYVHFFYWFSCTRMAEIPVLLLELRGDLLAWRSRDANGAKAALRKVDLHMEYLTGRSVIVALASEKLSLETKDAMATALKAVPVDTHIEMGKPDIPRVYEDSKLEEFVTEESWLFFKLCNFDPTFLSKPAIEWEDNDNFQAFRKLVNGFSPINDAAERAVKFASDFNGKITRDEKQHDAMLQGIEKHRHDEPKPTKK